MAGPTVVTRFNVIGQGYDAVDRAAPVGHRFIHQPEQSLYVGAGAGVSSSIMRIAFKSSVLIPVVPIGSLCSRHDSSVGKRGLDDRDRKSVGEGKNAKW